MLYGFLGVFGFSLTLPATRIAVAHLDPTVVGLGRALVAALLAAVVLVLTRQSIPSRKQFGALAIVAAGVVLGFPLLSAWALRQVHASHGAVMIGLLPLATAVVAALRVGERPSWQFWLASAVGSSAILLFAVYQGGGNLQLADLALLGAVAAAAVGYAEGGRLARELGGWQVISWALVLAAPFISLPVALAVRREGFDAPLDAWLSFGYVALVSQFLAFFVWYRGLAIGGVARVGQLQLLQPIITLVASALLLGEHITPAILLVALVVIGAVAVGRRATIARQARVAQARL
jgi:drug/metabolite transporter (DMT)-like permease